MHKREVEMLLFLFLFIPFAWTEEKNPTCLEKCYYEPPESCPGPDEPFRCKLSPSCPKAVVCCNLTQANIYDELRNTTDKYGINITALHIQNSEFDSFALNMSNGWRYLRSLAITHGRINKLGNKFPRFMKIMCLNLTSNGISEFANGSLAHLYALEIFDISHNNMTYVPMFRQGNVTVNILDNKLQCTSLQETLKYRKNITFANSQDTFCTTPSQDTWFNTTERLPLTQVERINVMESNCPIKNCTCKVLRLELLPGQSHYSASLGINCAKKQLTSLPPRLPDRTIALNVSYNNISSLDIISTEPSYSSLRDLDAAHNNITSILPLEASKFINYFVRLNLRYNNLKSVPTYVFNTLDRNDNTRLLSLGQNKLECDCNVAKDLKRWLTSRHIQDYEELLCENTGEKVMDLDPSELCQPLQDWTDYIYYIIAAEVILLVTLIAKVFYDYWVFKTAGYLPWPASKMPKLPCDWLCE